MFQYTDDIFRWEFLAHSFFVVPWERPTAPHRFKVNIVRDTSLSSLYRQKELAVRTALRERRKIFQSSSLLLLDVVTLWSCGLFFFRVWSLSSLPKHTWSNRFDVSSELSFFIIIPATLLFYLNFATTNLALAVDTETGTNFYISFPFEVHRNLKWVYQNNKTYIHPKAWGLPAKEMI